MVSMMVMPVLPVPVSIGVVRVRAIADPGGSGVVVSLTMSVLHF